MNDGTELWSNLIACTGSWIVSSWLIDISSDKSKVYTLSTLFISPGGSVWTTFDFVTGNVVGNRYLDPSVYDPIQLQEHNDYLLVEFNQVLALIAKYDKTTDTFTEHWEHPYKTFATISGISGNK